jgi:hypothetical protein
VTYLGACPPTSSCWRSACAPCQDRAPRGLVSVRARYSRR